MSIIDKKTKIFGNIAAAKTLTTGLPNLKTSNSFPSINNGGNSVLFLTDLIKSLIGYDALVTSLVDILSYALPEVEREVKTALKQELKNIVSCGVNPSLPAWIKSTGTGIVIQVNQIDFFDILKIDPDSPSGKLIYGDATDFNRFLYDAIQNDGVTQTWNNMLDVTFNSIGTINNTFTIKANSAYDNKTLTDLDNDYIDSINLFTSATVINNIIDSIFGSISLSIKKTTKQLENEAKVFNVIDCIVDSDADDAIDDNYFTFTNEEVYVHESQADQRKKGVVKLECCNKVAASIPVAMLTTFNDQMSAATSTQAKNEVIKDNLNVMATQNTINSSNPSDHMSIKLNFIQQLISNLIRTIISIILSPKVAMIFMINYKIIYGPTASYGDAIGFIKANKNLFKSIAKTISGLIIKKLLKIALKEIASLVAETAAMREVEKGKTRLAQLLSLVGIPQDTIRLLRGLL